MTFRVLDPTPEKAPPVGVRGLEEELRHESQARVPPLLERGAARLRRRGVRERGETGYRTRSELKNMNSFTFIARGIEAEVARQIGVWESGAEVEQQTYDFDASGGTLTPRRSKEEAEDYRYFPEPDLVPVEPAPELVERIRSELPEAPGERIRRYEPALGFALASDVVTAGRGSVYERLSGHVEPRVAANLLMNELTAAGVDEVPNVEELAKVVEARQEIPRESFLRAVAAAGDPGFHADDYLAEKVVADASELGPIVDEVLAANAGLVEAYRAGKEGLLGFFVGQVMKRTQGKASPRAVNELLREKLQA